MVAVESCRDRPALHCEHVKSLNASNRKVHHAVERLREHNPTGVPPSSATTASPFAGRSAPVGGALVAA
jgi:hypothetical protein